MKELKKDAVLLFWITLVIVSGYTIYVNPSVWQLIVVLIIVYPPLFLLLALSIAIKQKYFKKDNKWTLI